MSARRDPQAHAPIPLPAAVLFDLDGTLVDSLDDIAHALNTARAEAGLDPSHRDQVRGWIGGGAARLVSHSIGAEEHDPAARALLAKFLHVYRTESGRRSPLLPGARALLDALRARGVLLACTTNKPEDATHLVLRSLGIDGHFGAVVTPDTTPGVKKPDARFFADALARLGGVPAARALVVGDGLPDVAGGRAAGCPTVAVLDGYGDREALLAAGPDFTVEATGELLGRMGL